MLLYLIRVAMVVFAWTLLVVTIRWWHVVSILIYLVPISCAAAPDTCRNGGTCTDNPLGAYSCTCAPGFEGQNCEGKKKRMILKINNDWCWCCFNFNSYNFAEVFWISLRFLLPTSCTMVIIRLHLYNLIGMGLIWCCLKTQKLNQRWTNEQTFYKEHRYTHKRIVRQNGTQQPFEWLTLWSRNLEKKNYICHV